MLNFRYSHPSQHAARDGLIDASSVPDRQHDGFAWAVTSAAGRQAITFAAARAPALRRACRMKSIIAALTSAGRSSGDTAATEHDTVAQPPSEVHNAMLHRRRLVQQHRRPHKRGRQFK
jgi:hypothetical protein